MWMKALITDGIDREGLDVLSRYGIDADIKKLDPEQLLHEIPEYDAIVVRSVTKVTEDVIERGASGKLKLIARSGVGYDNIDASTASRYGIPVMIAPHGNTNAVAELVMGTMVVLSRNITKANESLRSGKWVKKPYEGCELRGKTVGIAGYGRIGREVAAKCRAFDMDVIAFDIYPITSSGARQVEKDVLLAASDYLTLHLPYSGESPFLGKDELSQMKSTAFLINTSRGEVIDENALYDAVCMEQIAGAALDVHRKEGKEGQPYDNRLVLCSNVLALPHIGASTREAQSITSADIAKGIGEYFLNSVISDRVQIVNYGDGIESGIECRPNSLYVTHDNKKGMFRRISRVFERYGINIQRIPSNSFKGNEKQATSAFRIYQAVPGVALREIRSVPGVYRVTL